MNEGSFEKQHSRREENLKTKLDGSDDDVLVVSKDEDDGRGETTTENQTLETQDQPKIPELNIETVTAAQAFLLQRQDELNLILTNLSKPTEQDGQIVALSNDFINKAATDKLFADFDTAYSEAVQKINEINPGHIDLEQNFELDNLFSTILETQQSIDFINSKKDLLYLQTTEFSALQNSTSNEKIVDEIGNLEHSGSITPQEAQKLKTKLEKVQDFASISFDRFVELNEGSSLDTFLSFLIDPVRTKGKTGESLNFGRSNLGEEIGNVEVVPLHLFRSLFTESKKVGAVLKTVADKVDQSFRSEHGELFDSLGKGENPAKNKEALLLIFNKLLVNNEQSDEKIKYFRVHFATALTGESENQYMDDASFAFLVDNLKDGGEKLDSLWGIK
jgi:hypothetical protein